MKNMVQHVSVYNKDKHSAFIWEEQSFFLLNSRLVYNIFNDKLFQRSSSTIPQFFWLQHGRHFCYLDVKTWKFVWFPCFGAIKETKAVAFACTLQTVTSKGGNPKMQTYGDSMHYFF